MTPNERNQRIEDLRKQAAEPGADMPAIREEIATLLDSAKPITAPTDTTVFTEMNRLKAELAQARQELAELRGAREQDNGWIT